MFCNNNSAKICYKYFCDICQYGTQRKSSYDDHILSLKHLKVTESYNNYVNSATNKKKIVCKICNKEYNNRTSLWRHNKICKENVTQDNLDDIQTNVQSMLTDKELMMALIKDNADFKAMMMKIFENGTNHMSHSHNHTNSHNKTFNLQFFLNETCKNAMNIDEFVSSIQPTLEDLEHVGKVGYAEGISSIIIKKLHEVGVTQRPIHCSDIKREVMYVKSDDVWQKEVENKTLLVSAIKQVAKDNIDNILVWQKANPGCTDADSRLNKKYLNMIMNSMSGSSEDEAQKNLNKIIARVSNSVPVSKILQVPT